MNPPTRDAHSTRRLALGALGVVFGDIGTSPLYAFQQCLIDSSSGRTPSPDTVYGLLSLILWALILIVSFKYVMFIMRADHHGEGGILALLALLLSKAKEKFGKRAIYFLTTLGVLGAAFLYGDGIITPAISVLSAMEGLELVDPALAPWVPLLTILILVGLFSFQRFGTAVVGRIFGPIMLLWFLTLAGLGISQIVQHPQVLYVFDPGHAIAFFRDNGGRAFIVLGSVFLAVTGAEALYADLGHFGRKPIRLAWYGLVLPALVLNYLGQGAFVLVAGRFVDNPFYALAPGWMLYPLVGLATMATVIASQALISGAFSVTLQSMQLRLFPRMAVKHTSHSERGQVYLPFVNYALMLGCIGLVLGFRNASNLAAAYGIAVTITMVITTILFGFTARLVWRWPLLWVLPLCAIFLAVEGVFFGANIFKIPNGGWFAVLAGLAVFIVMTTWKQGRTWIMEQLQSEAVPLDDFLDSLSEDCERHQHRVEGCAVFLTANRGAAPIALRRNLQHNKVLHETVIILTLETKTVPYVDLDESITIEKLPHGFYRVVSRVGYMQPARVPRIINSLKDQIPFDPEEVTYFISGEHLVLGKRGRMSMWRRRLFAALSRNAVPASDYFDLPPERVIAIGIQVVC